MDFRQKSPKEKPVKAAKVVTATKRKSAVNPGQPQIDGFAQKVSNPISRQRSRQEILEAENDFDTSPWGDTDDEYEPDKDDPIELTDGGEGEDEVVPMPTKSNGKQIKRSFMSEVIENNQQPPSREDTGTPVDKCFGALQQMKNSVSPALLQHYRKLITLDGRQQSHGAGLDSGKPGDDSSNDASEWVT